MKQENILSLCGKGLLFGGLLLLSFISSSLKSVSKEPRSESYNGVSTIDSEETEGKTKSPLEVARFSPLAPMMVEICNNGIDDDGDGLIDCFDGDCFSDGTACPAFEFSSLCSPTGGKRASLISTATAYRAEGTATAATFTIPVGATRALVYLSSADGQTGSGQSPEDTDEDFINAGAVLDLINATSAGYLNYAKNTNTDGSGTQVFGWEDVDFGDKVSTGAGVGHDVSPSLTDLTFSVVGSTLTITEDDTDVHSSFVVEFTSAAVESMISTGFETVFLDNGTAAANRESSVAIPANTEVIFLTGKGVGAIQGPSGSPGGGDEGFSNIRFTMDLSAGSDGLLDGFVTVANGGDSKFHSTYVVTDHDLASTSSFITGSTVSGDILTKETATGGDGDVGLFDPKVYISGGNLIIERDNGYAADFEDVYTIEFFRRITEPMAAEFIDSEILFMAEGTGSTGSVDGSDILSGGTVREFTIPAGSEFAFFNMAGNANNSNNEANENPAAAYAVIDLTSESANGYYFQQVGHSGSRRDHNVAFKDLLLDYSSAVANGIGQKASNDYDMAFELSTGKDKLSVMISSDLVPGEYQYVLSMDFFGSKPDLASSATKIDFTKGATCKELDVNLELCNPGAGKSPEGMPISFYDADPTVDPAAVLLATQSFNNVIDVGTCASFTFTLDLSAYDNIDFPMTIVINDDGSFVPGGEGNAVGTTFTLADLETQDSDFTECDYSNNKVIQNTNVNNCPISDNDGDDSSGATGFDYLTYFAASSAPVDITDTDLDIVDLDDSDIHSATITLTNRPDGTDEMLSLSGGLPTGIGLTPYVPGTGVLVLTGQRPVSDYVTALRLLQYQNVNATPDITDREITFVLNDGEEDGPPSMTTVKILTTPEIDVTGSGVAIANGDASPATADGTDFGTINSSGTVTRTFTITNVGTGTINLGGATSVTLSGAPEFSVVTQPAGTTINSGNSLTFDIEFDPTSDNTYMATVSIANDDSDENPYEFDIIGTAGDVEICDNGIDDDGDGLIDCFDPDCTGSTNCGGFYFNQPVPTCIGDFTRIGDFELEEDFRTDKDNYPVDQRSGVFVGDLDRDGISELVGKNPGDNGVGSAIQIFNGNDGSLKRSISLPAKNHSYSQVAIGNVDDDNTGDIFIVLNNSRVYRYDISGTQVWQSAVLNGSNMFHASPHLADFDEDGTPEVYVGVSILAATNGTVLVNSDNDVLSSGNVGSDGDRLPIAFDVFKNGDALPPSHPSAPGVFGSEADGLELIAGDKVYTVDLAGGSLAVAAQITAGDIIGKSGGDHMDGFTSIADMDGDDKVDIIVVSAGHVYAWNPRTESQLGYIDLTGTSNGGRANVGDFDNDGQVEIGVAGRNYYFMLEYDAGGEFQIGWLKGDGTAGGGIDDGSQRTGSTLFDFEGDGRNEVVYSEEEKLFIFDGVTGDILASVTSQSGTRTDYPLVADVNADGQSEIIVTAQDRNGPSNSEKGYITVYKSAKNPWVGSRETWNQHGYYVTNINNDLTIPQQVQNPLLIEFDRTIGGQVSGAFNGFLIQTTFLTATGVPTLAAADALATITDLTVDTDGIYTVTYDLDNNASASLPIPAGMYISFWNGDPDAGGVLIGTDNATTNIDPGDGITGLTFEFSGIGAVNNVYVVANNSGVRTGTSTTLSAPGDYIIAECDYNNNALFLPAPVNVAPQVDLNGSDELGFDHETTFTEGGGPIELSQSTEALVLDGDASDIKGATVTLTNLPDGTDEVLAVTVGATGIVAIYDSGTGILTLTGTTTLANYQQVLRTLTYDNADDDPDDTDRIIEVKVTDDSDKESNTAIATVNVTPVNDPPVAADKTLTTAEDTPLLIQTGDFGYNDPDTDALDKVTIATLPGKGTLFYDINNNQSYDAGEELAATDEITKANLDKDSLYYVPVADEFGDPYTTFTFTVNDGTVNSNPANTITIDVTPVNDPPTAADKTLTTPEDTPLLIQTADFSYADVDNDPFDKVTIATIPGKGILFYDINNNQSYDAGEELEASDEITKANLDKDSLYYVPVPDEFGDPYTTFTFTVNDGTVDSNPANTITIDVTPVNDPPTAADKTLTTAEDTPVVVTTGDLGYSDTENDPLDKIEITLLPTAGTLFVDTDGDGEVDAGEEVSLNDDISKADLDAGRLKFLPDADENGSPYADFDFNVNDGTEDAAADNTITFNVTPVNDPPTGADKTLTTPEDTPIVIATTDLGYMDTEGTDLDKIEITLLPTAGTLFIDTDGDGVVDTGEEVSLNDDISKADLDAGRLKFLPDADENGSPYADFDFNVNDGTEDAAADNTITFNVTPVNDPPTAADKTLTTLEDTRITVVTADFGYSDLEGDPLTEITIGTIAGRGVFFLDADDDNVADAGEVMSASDVIAVADLDAGRLKFRPETNENGSDYASFNFTVSDGMDDAISENVITIDVTPVNDRPFCDDEILTTSEDTPLVIKTDDFDYSDPEGNPLAEIVIVNLPDDGVLFLDENENGILDEGEEIRRNDRISKRDLDDGQLIFVPAPDDTGSPYTDFKFRVSDGSAESAATYTITINVTPVNDSPAVEDDDYTIDEDTQLEGNVLDNDNDIEGTLTVSETPISGPEHGQLTLNPDGTFTYLPEEDFVGEDTFVYQACDSGDPVICLEATVTITVEENRSIDIAVEEVCIRDTPYVQYEITAVGFTPEQGATITWRKMDGEVAEQLVDQPLTGSLLWPGAEVDADGNPIAWPGWLFENGMWIQLNDGLRPEMTLEVSINPENSVIVSYPPATPACNANPRNRPVAHDDGTSIGGGETAEIPLPVNDVPGDSPLDPGTIILIDPGDPGNVGDKDNPLTIPGEGTYTVNEEGTLTFVPENGFGGTSTIEYTIADEDGERSVPATVVIEVGGQTGPTADDFTIEVSTIDGTTSTVIPHIFDPSGGPVTLTKLSDPTVGTLLFNPDGTFTYVHPPGFEGTLEFVYEVCDSGSPIACDQGTVTIVVLPMDTDEDSLLDSFEVDDPDDPKDSDEDGTPDYLDPDDDGDMVPTIDENYDGDDDVTNQDSDGDGTPDYLDVDDDGDTILTEDEDIDFDSDPQNDDVDNDNTPNYLDIDSDGDGIPDEYEGLIDTDGDGTPDFADLDSDNDGVPDIDEVTSDNPLDDDCDGDGIPDFRDPFSCDEFPVNQVMTPNFDNINDIMEITGIEYFPGNEVFIFNRWGNLVWRIEGYDNVNQVFTGFGNEGNLGSTDLPDGTYFYIIDRRDGTAVQKGFVVIKR
ncbi:MAG: tandem-95 repeat protein [Cyclobacteriaceae bacterium]